jgi:peptidoglycan hydrolase-like protein with peptidoglycan-binding domain
MRTFAAVAVLAVAIGAPAWAAEPAPSAVGFERAEPAMSPDRVRDLQQKLMGLGYEVGRIDGVIGPRTREGIASFQRDHRLEASGHLNERTVAALEAVGRPTAGTP